MDVDEGDAAAPILLDNPEVVLDDVDDILTEEGLVECLDLGEVSEDEVWVEPLKHEVGGVAEGLWVVQEAPAGRLGPLAAGGAQAVAAVVTHAVLHESKSLDASRVQPMVKSRMMKTLWFRIYNLWAHINKNEESYFKCLRAANFLDIFMLQWQGSA